ncbi:MAG: glycosyltransferase family 25 protein [Helicobacteraceae bacterium]|nr:glycosyltransferase family 25 protein [Helicobacteraceae bacterium]
MCKVFIINLKSEVKRKEYIINLCEKYKLDFEIIEAVNGRELSEVELAKISDESESKKRIGRILTKGEFGCALSHKKALSKMLELNLSECIILEDDASFDKNLLEFLSLRESLPKNLDLLLLGHYRQVYLDDGFRIESPFSRRFSYNLNFKYSLKRLVGGGFGTHGLYWRARGAAKMLKYLEKIILPYDYYTSDDSFVNVYALYPIVVETDEVFGKETSVQENINRIKRRPKWRKYIKRLKKEVLFLIPSFKNLREYK